MSLKIKTAGLLLSTFTGTLFVGFPSEIFAGSEEGLGTIDSTLQDNLRQLSPNTEKAEKFEKIVEKVYTPARRQVRKGTTVVKPFYAYYGQRLPASINKGGKMSSSTYGTGVSWLHVDGEESLISLANMDYRRTDFRWSGVPAGPFQNVDSLSAFLWQEWVYDRGNGRAISGFLTGKLIAEDGTDLSYGLAGGIGLGVKQYFSKTESIWLGGIATYSRHREKWVALPMAFFDWAPTKNWNLRVGNGVTATWDVEGDASLLLALGISYETGSIAVDRGEVWYSQSAPLVFTATWNLTKNIFVSFGVNTILWSDYRYWEGGHEQDEHFTVDTSLDFSLQAGFRF